jgi:hypothetical protein
MKFAMDLSLDLSPASLFASFVVGLVGMGLLIYGKKTLRIPHLVCGVALSVYPFFVSGAGWILGIGAVLILGLWGPCARGCERRLSPASARWSDGPPRGRGTGAMMEEPRGQRPRGQRIGSALALPGALRRNPRAGAEERSLVVMAEEQQLSSWPALEELRASSRASIPACA